MPSSQKPTPGAVVNVHAAKTQFSKLLARAERGEEIIIARAGKPVAKLMPVVPTQKPRAQPGFLKGVVEIVGDIDEPMDEEFLDLFYNGPIFPDEERKT